MSEKLSKLIQDTIAENNSVELAIGYLRYKALRNVTPRKFKELHETNVKKGQHFDDLVDELIES